MLSVPSTLREDYWTTFEIQDEDIEFLYNHLLELELPQTSAELLDALVRERIRTERQAIERQRSAGGDVYFPKEEHRVGQRLVFPQLGWQCGEVVDTRPGRNPDLDEFSVIRVKLQHGETREFASSLGEHLLNQPPQLVEDDGLFDVDAVLETYSDELLDCLEACLRERDDFVRIAGRWFPRTLLVDINAGHLNLAEAILDMAGGGPMTSSVLMQQLELPTNVNAKLIEFSLDLALQEDERFDEVGPAGQIVWFLHRLEPADVLQAPLPLRYTEIEYERAQLTAAMLTLEKELDDELSPFDGKVSSLHEVQIRLIYPHWRAGTLPLSARMRPLFPTAHETPRIQLTLVDGDTGERLSAWVVRQNRYVSGLSDWYAAKGVVPGSLINVRRGERDGEVVVQVNTHRPTKEYIRTVLVGSDGGTVFAMLKQSISTPIDERMAISVPDVEALDEAWSRLHKERTPFEKVVVNIVRELARLNPQSHVHASELYAAVNIVRRCPPGPIFALLASRPWFNHVGDLHFRFDDSEK
ncbi:MAG: hypothetical protein ACOYYS_24710 [Chloroflexota bacterium]